MPVPDDDTLCRFVRAKDWSRRDNRPKPGAFKQHRLSVWHADLLARNGIALSVLCIGSLEGSGQAFHTAGDYPRIAAEASAIEQTAFAVQVEWRPEDDFVGEEWRQWRYAHVQAESIEGPGDFLSEFRRQLALQTRSVVAPESVPG